MTNVFLLMWLADFVGHARFLFVIFSFILGVGTIFCTIANLERWGEDRGMFLKFKYWVIMVVSLFILLSISAILPSRNTVLLLAGIEAGNVAIHTEVGQKAIQALSVELDKIIRGDN